MKRSLLTALLLMTFCFASTARADIIYTNLASLRDEGSAVGMVPNPPLEASPQLFYLGAKVA